MSAPESVNSAPVSGPAAAARLARSVSRKLAVLRHDQRNAALELAANRLDENDSHIVAANSEDVHAAEPLVRAGKMSPALLSRLRVSEKTVADMAEKIRSVVRLPDPLGRKLSAMELDQGLVLTKESCPLGVVAVVFESRPDVVPQVASLALKSGNAILLKGGSEAARTNAVLINLWNQALHDSGVPDGAAQMLQSRADVMELLHLERDVDLLVPRGGKDFVQSISRQSRIPVLGHGEGICHIYVHASADPQKAERILLDAKTVYPAACNSVETLLVDAAIAPAFLPQMVARLRSANVEIRACERTRAIIPSHDVVPATEEDWSTEYGDLILSVKIVDNLEAAIAHIHRYGSSHTEAIIAEDSAAAELFLSEVDAAGVFHNASTRFADGYRYGLGAEVGISNGKLHARGPMGLEGLTTYKYKLRGSGQSATDYNSTHPFRHRPL